MRQLYTTIAWLEFVRARSRSLLLLILILALSLSLSTCGGADVNISVSSQSSFSSEHHSSGMSQGLTNPVGMLYKKVIDAAPFAFISLWIIALGCIVLLTIPFRGRQEWENGQFQMVAMGDYSFYFVELARFASYLSLALLFFAAVGVCSSYYAWKHDIIPMQFIVNIQLLIAYWFIGLVPLMLAFGVLVSAINTAYYRDGNSKILSLVKYISCCSFALLVLKTAFWFSRPEHNLLPTSQVLFDIPNVKEIAIGLNWEFPILSLITTGLLIFWSARILEEVEA